MVERSSEREEERQWPGQVFADESLDYSEAMLEYVNASRAENECEKPAKDRKEAEKESVRARKRAIRQEEEDLRKQRRAVREQRKLEDAAWQTLKTERKQQLATPSDLTSQGGKAQDEQWRAQRHQRQESTKQRKQEDEDWRQQRLSIRERLSLLPIVKAWIAIPGHHR